MTEDPYEGLSDKDLEKEIKDAGKESLDIMSQRKALKAQAMEVQAKQDALKAEFLKRNPPNPTGAIGG